MNIPWPPVEHATTSRNLVTYVVKVLAHILGHSQQQKTDGIVDWGHKFSRVVVKLTWADAPPRSAVSKRAAWVVRVWHASESRPWRAHSRAAEQQTSRHFRFIFISIWNTWGKGLIIWLTWSWKSLRQPAMKCGACGPNRAPRKMRSNVFSHS